MFYDLPEQVFILNFSIWKPEHKKLEKSQTIAILVTAIAYKFSGQVVKNIYYRYSKFSYEFKFHIDMSARSLPREIRAIYQPHNEANFKKSNRISGGGTVSARRGARTVVK